MANPGKEGTTVGGEIKTAMNATNVGKKNTPGTKSYGEKEGVPGGARGGGSTIHGPGQKGSWKK